ncbi:hypothetical protein GCM10010339_62230 [Streptomyces alanosinicus]|uniref:Uncharacterized protein n=1 Tax=Streptomyces alanosinicus TaxID=68171 RepID=A0A919D6V0_9ACTN|nr:hypothetical protein GCM10010339_62230 [Streptomyces alanosinicus]
MSVGRSACRIEGVPAAHPLRDQPSTGWPIRVWRSAGPVFTWEDFTRNNRTGPHRAYTNSLEPAVGSWTPAGLR